MRIRLFNNGDPSLDPPDYMNDGGWDECIENVTAQQIGEVLLEEDEEFDCLSIYQLAEFLAGRYIDEYSSDVTVAMKRLLGKVLNIDPATRRFAEEVAELARHAIPCHVNHVEEKIAQDDYQRRYEE
ncbi:MAG: hypothetical protein M1356_09240 [Gammaproteobacteria bacterium]|nr:hypothetical protein [Gammaproteobacteria bacterium]